jgi:hypothetical protein
VQACAEAVLGALGTTKPNAWITFTSSDEPGHVLGAVGAVARAGGGSAPIVGHAALPWLQQPREAKAKRRQMLPHVSVIAAHLPNADVHVFDSRQVSRDAHGSLAVGRSLVAYWPILVSTLVVDVFNEAALHLPLGELHVYIPGLTAYTATPTRLHRQEAFAAPGAAVWDRGGAPGTFEGPHGGEHRYD